MRQRYIYKITSPSGRVYIGLTSNLASRKSNYRNKDCGGQILLSESLRKYGWEAHKFEVVFQGECTLDCLRRLEKLYIKMYKSNKSRYPEQNGLNLTDGGEGYSGPKSDKWKESRRGRTESIESNKKRSDSQKGKPKPEGFGKHNILRGTEVVQYTKDGEKLQEFESLSSAARSVGGTPREIQLVCQEKAKTARGFIWKYKREA